MTCSLCSNSGVINHPEVGPRPCICSQGAAHRKFLNRAAMNGYVPPHCNGTDDLAQRIESIRANPPVPSTLPSLKPIPKPKLTSGPEFDNIRTLLVGMVLGALVFAFWAKALGWLQW